MSARKAECKYKYLGRECHHDEYEDGRCIFHLRKQDKSKLKPGTDDARCEEIELKFTSKFKKLMKDTENDESTDSYNFFGFKFPEINLRRTIFKKIADFSMAEFRNKADFFHAKFRNEADFFSAKFRNKANFSLAEFQNKANFSWAKFQNKANFNWATFEGKTLFEGIKKGDVKGWEENLCFYSFCNFHEIQLGEDARVVFNKVDLGQASFLDTDIVNFTFRDVDWHRPEHGKWLIRWLKKILCFDREKVLFDEFRHQYPEEGKKEKSPEEVDYSKLAENYSQLVLNYEKKRDFLSAHEFRIGEMEARRKSLGAKAKRNWWKKIRKAVNAYTLYGFLSGYGTSYRQALGVLALMLLGFALAFFFSGFQTLSPQGAPLESINYDLAFDFSNICQKFFDYFRAFLFTLSIITLQRSRFYVPTGAWSQLWLFLATICFYSQVTLLLLAIRRRFKQ